MYHKGVSLDLFCICCIQEIFLNAIGATTADFADGIALLATGVSIEAATHALQSAVEQVTR